MFLYHSLFHGSCSDLMAEKAPNNDTPGIPAVSSITSGITPSASDPGPVMPTSASNIALGNSLTTPSTTVVGSQPPLTAGAASLPINTLQNVVGNPFSDPLASHSTQG